MNIAIRYIYIYVLMIWFYCFLCKSINNNMPLYSYKFFTFGSQLRFLRTSYYNRTQQPLYISRISIFFQFYLLKTIHSLCRLCILFIRKIIIVWLYLDPWDMPKSSNVFIETSYISSWLSLIPILLYLIGISKPNKCYKN